MLKEVFNNQKVQILLDDETNELSFGYFPEAFTTYEHWLLARAFDLTEEYDE